MQGILLNISDIRGIYENITEAQNVIDITKVVELATVTKDPLEIGAGVSMSSSINIFKVDWIKTQTFLQNRWIFCQKNY